MLPDCVALIHRIFIHTPLSTLSVLHNRRKKKSNTVLECFKGKKNPFAGSDESDMTRNNDYKVIFSEILVFLGFGDRFGHEWSALSGYILQFPMITF